MIVNKYGNGGGGSASGVTPEQVQQEIQSALTPYWNSGETEDAISAATSGKADAVSVQANNNWQTFARWNSQGVITGAGNSANSKNFDINGARFKPLSLEVADWPRIWAPQSAGTAGDILVSAGNGAPVWSAVTFPVPDVDKAYVDSADTIIYASATSRMDDVEQVVSSALNEFHTQLMELSARTVNLSAYTPTANFATINGSAITNGGNIVIEGGDVQAIQDQVDEIDEVVSQALVDLDGRMNTVSGSVASISGSVSTINTNISNINTSLSTKVSSTSVTTIWKGTQVQYDAIVNKDPYTFYIIVNN